MNPVKSLLKIIAAHIWEQPPMLLLAVAIVVPMVGLLLLYAIILCEPFIKIALGLFSAAYLTLFLSRVAYLLFKPRPTRMRKQLR